MLADHRPGRAWRLSPLDRESSRAPALPTPRKARHKPSAEATSGLPTASPRPLWLLRKAIPLRAQPLHILAGPERIESGWWDGDDQRHDYYIVQTPAGQRAWAYVADWRDRQWMLQDGCLTRPVHDGVPMITQRLPQASSESRANGETPDNPLTARFPGQPAMPTLAGHWAFSWDLMKCPG